MSLVCGQCSRVNPPDAAYCYHDGAALAGRAGGPVNAGAAPFPNQFVFPDGLACRNFDQLAMACQQNWSSAKSLLQQGFLGSFFGGMGRVDLAMAAQEAAKFPDLDRGLDQLLGKLPSQALQAPKLEAAPSVINLGQVKIGEDRTTELHLSNLGSRLLYGTVTSDCEWLTVGEGAGHNEKMFQFGAEATIPIHVRGQHLRAGAKPLEGHLIIDSNANPGEPILVTCKADVPITPYPDGMFAGAVTPRVICEKAKAKPKDAAPLFEHGDIARWYASNGWKYPVQGPIMSGMGAIQQFFEALGVGKPPKVEFNPKSLDLNGAVGKTIDAVIEVTTPDKKVVYGWATCDQPWVEIGKTKLGRAAATIPITIRIPNPAPPTLSATLNVVGNGHQKLAVPVNVKVAGGKAGVVLQEELTPVVMLEDEAPAAQTLEAPASNRRATPVPAPAMVVEERNAAPAPPAPMLISEMIQEESPFSIMDAPKSSAGAPAAPMVSVAQPTGRLPLPVRLVLHMIPVGILFFLTLILLVHDIFFAGKTDAGDDPIDPNPLIELKFDEGRQGNDYIDSMTFAVHRLPDVKGGPKKKLNWYENGFGNSTVIRIDGQDKAFGITPTHGKWAQQNDKGKPVEGKTGKSREFEMKPGIYVTQTVTIEPGEAVEYEKDKYKRYLSMCLVRYKIHNRDPSKATHEVGLRVLMDTCIGENDGVPFTFPGVSEVVTDKRDLRGPEVPDFIQVLEKPNLRDPGIIMQLNLRFMDKDKYEAPNRFQLTRYPGNDRAKLDKWEVPLDAIKRPGEPEGDSAVAIYWEPKPLGPGKTRELAFTYGLGSVAVAENSKIGLTIGGATYVNGEFTVLALIADKEANNATITLPEGLTLKDPKTRTQPVIANRPDESGQVRPSPVTWIVRADKEGKHNIRVETNTGAEKSRRVTITAKSLFN